MREHGNRGVMALFTVEEICEVLSVRPPAGVTAQDLKQRIRRVQVLNFRTRRLPALYASNKVAMMMDGVGIAGGFVLFVD